MMKKEKGTLKRRRENRLFVSWRHIMKFVGALVIVLLSVLLYGIALKLIGWMLKFDKKTDMKWFGAPLEDYENDKRCVIAEVTVAFVLITAGLLYLFLTRG